MTIAFLFSQDRLSRHFKKFFIEQLSKCVNIFLIIFVISYDVNDFKTQDKEKNQINDLVLINNCIDEQLVVIVSILGIFDSFMTFFSGIGSVSSWEFSEPQFINNEENSFEQKKEKNKKCKKKQTKREKKKKDFYITWNFSIMIGILANPIGKFSVSKEFILILKMPIWYHAHSAVKLKLFM